MSDTAQLSARARVLAVLVLYGRAAADSPAYTALHAFQQRTGGRSAIDLLVFDNSAPGYTAPAGLFGTYVSCPTNPGLAEPYNHALASAESDDVPWLMLLDQDTHLTGAYLQEVLDQTAVPPAGHVVALVPRLFAGAGLLSPHIQPYWPPQRPLTTDIQGIPDRRLHYFNSGAVLSTAALRAIGGFPPDFWLDYLDHAVFFQLQQQGGRIRILRSALQHDLASESHAGPVTPARLQRERNTRQAAMQYFLRYERGHRLLQHRAALLWKAVFLLLRGKHALARELASTALQKSGARA